MKKLTQQPESTSEIRRQRTSSRNTIIVTALLVIALLAGSGATASGSHLDTRDIAWVGVTLVTLAILARSLVVNYYQADERQKLVQLKATSIAFAVLICGLVAIQLLHALDLIDLNIALQCLVIGGVVLWAALLKLIERRNYL